MLTEAIVALDEIWSAQPWAQADYDDGDLPQGK